MRNWREAAKQIRNKMVQYRQVFNKSDVDVKDLLAMVTAYSCRCRIFSLKDRNDTSPFAEKMRELGTNRKVSEESVIDDNKKSFRTPVYGYSYCGSAFFVLYINE
jgi:hypothetical protein